MPGCGSSLALAAALNLLAALSFASAGWVSIPPDGADTLAIAFSRSEPGVVWAGTADGLYRSEDGGASWSVAGLRGTWLQTVAVHPYDGRNVWVSNGPTLWRSDDGGATFAQHVLGAPGFRSHDLALDFEDPDVAYLTKDADLFITRDGGATWSKVPRMSGQAAFGWYRPILSTPGAVLAGNRNGLYRSTDHGATWALVGPEPSNELGSIASDASGQRLWVVADSHSIPPPFTSPAVLTSANGGLSWSLKTGHLPEGATPWGPVTVNPDGGLVLLRTTRGLFASTDDGTSWSEPARPTCTCPGWSTFVFDPAETEAVLAVVQGGLARSTDGGATWGCAVRGMRDVSVTALLAASDGSLWAATYDQGIFTSGDAGSSWSYAGGSMPRGTIAGPEYTEHFTVLTLAEVDGAIVAGTSDGAYRTVDGGASWSRIDGIDGRVGAFLQDPGRTETLLAATMGFGLVRGGLFVSRDGGSTWTEKLGDAWAAGIAVDPQSGALLASVRLPAGYYGSSFTGIVRSTDHGLTWTQASALTDLATLVADSRVPGRIWAANGRLFRSDDGGLSWTEVASPSPCEPPSVECGPFTLLVDAPRDRLLVVAGDQVYASLDDGASWGPLVPAVPVHGGLGLYWPNIWVSSEAVLALDASGRLFAGTGGRGLFVLETDVRVPRRRLSR